MALQVKGKTDAATKQAPAAPAAPPAPDAAPTPGAEADTGEGKGKKKREKKEKVKRVKMTVPEGGFETWPTDFNPKVNKPLRRQDFKDETVWLDHKATDMETKAKEYRDESENIKKLGPSKDRKKAKKLLAVQGELDTMKAALAAQGVDVDAMLAAYIAKATPASDAAAAPATDAPPATPAAT